MKLVNKFKTIYFFRQVGEALIFSFFSLYLSLYGFDDYEVGQLMGIMPLVMLIATPLLGLIDDGGKREKILLVVTIALIGVLPFLLFIPNLNYYWMGLLIVIMTIVKAPIMPAIDSMSTVVAINNGRYFSEIRVWASIAYSILMAVGGLLIDLIGFNYIILISSILTVATAVLVATVPLQDIGRPNDSTNKGDYKQLFKNKNFLSFVLINILTWAVWSASYNYEGVYFAEKFDNASMFGYIEGARVVFEIVAMYLLIGLRDRLKVKFAYLCFGLTALAKYIIYYFNMPTISLFILSPFMGFSFGMILFCYVDYITKIVRKHNIHIALFVLTSAQMLFNAICTYTGSIIVKHTGFFNVYILLGGLTVLGIVTIIFFTERSSQAIQN